MSFIFVYFECLPYGGHTRQDFHHASPNVYGHHYGMSSFYVEEMIIHDFSSLDGWKFLMIISLDMEIPENKIND